MSFPTTISKKTLLPILLLAAGACALSPSGVSGYLRGVAQVVLLPLSDATTGMAATIRGRAAALGTASARHDRQLEQIQRDNDTLRYALAAEQTRLAEHLRIDQQKENLYGVLADFPCQLIPARVVAAQSLPYGSTRVVRASAARAGALATTLDLVTDRSKNLPENLWAMDTKALVGRIVATGEFTAELQFVTDAAFKIDALIWRDPATPRDVVMRRGNTITKEPLTPQNNEMVYVSEVKGDGTGGLCVLNVLDDRHVLPGDWLVTTGRSGFMPDRIRIGRVTEVKVDHDHPGMVTLLGRPCADLETLREVFIVLPLGGARGGR